MDSQPEHILSDELARESEVSLRRSLIKLFITALVVLCSILLVHSTSVRNVLTDIHIWKRELAAVGAWGPIVFVILAAALVAAGFPRLFMSTFAGTLFGFGVGFPAAWLAATLGALVNFLFVRWGARTGAQRMLRIPSHLRALLYHPGFLSVVFMRLLPVWGLAQNAALALTNIKPGMYVTGTLCGILPSTIIVTLIGSGIGKASFMDALRDIGLAMIATAVLAAVLWYLSRKHIARTAA